MRAITRLVTALAVAVAAVMAAGHLVAGPGSDRSIAFYNIHTKETLSVTYKKSGKYDPVALKQIDWMMRDWRKNEEAAIDPGLVDLLWDIHAELGSRQPIHLICGYRSRGTNEMLRRNVGGQASESRHILGKAADVHFPDVPVRQLRYSALIREKGGVGYYPTSALPFVHLDTDHVRHWPRMPRFELALLFPNGSTRHTPSDGGPITKADVATARASHKELATQVAEFFTVRTRAVGATPGFAVASATHASPTPSGRMAALSPAPAPKLVADPRPVDRPSRFVLPTHADRQRLAELASAPAPPLLVTEPRRIERRQTLGSSSHAEPPLRLAALDPDGIAGAATALDGHPTGWSSGYASAPAYDEEHPEELSYRPFPVAPLLTETASIDDPVLARMSAPEVARTIDLLDQAGPLIPIHLRPGQAVTERMWTQEFRGDAVNPAALAALTAREDEMAGLIQRTVRTAQGE